MDLAELTDPDLIDTRLEGDDRHTALKALAELMARRGPATLDVHTLLAHLEQREALGSTGIGHGVAIPHCRMKGVDRVLLAIGASQRPVPFDALDGEPVRLFFLVVSPAERPAAHLKCLAAIARWVKRPEQVAALLAVADRQALFAMLPGAPEPVPPPTPPVVVS